MSWSLVLSDQYGKRLRHFLKRHPEMKKPYLKTLELLLTNPHHPSLRLHALSGPLTGLYSVAINLSYRLTLEFLLTDQEIILVNVGDHETVY